MDDAVRFVIGDLAEAVADAIVNPVNPQFQLGSSGVNGALLMIGGAPLADACRDLASSGVGSVRVTEAGRLSARHVIHAVSPAWLGGARGERDELRRLHEVVVETASRLGCRTIALPAIACGTHGAGFPPEIAGEIAVAAVEDALERSSVVARAEFVFRNRTILHDYAARSRSTTSHELGVRALRDEIAEILGTGVNAAIAEEVSELDDEDVLREIHETARTIVDEEAGFSSLSIAAVYARAARLILHEAGRIVLEDDAGSSAPAM